MPTLPLTPPNPKIVKYFHKRSKNHLEFWVSVVAASNEFIILPLRLILVDFPAIQHIRCDPVFSQQMSLRYEGDKELGLT